MQALALKGARVIVVGGGLIAFAGDHTSRQWQGYMNGAVESGARAAREIETMKLMENVPVSAPA